MELQFQLYWRVADVPFNRLFIVHIPVVELSGSTDRRYSKAPVVPKGIKSLIFIYLAVSGPLLVAVTINVTLFPQ